MAAFAMFWLKEPSLLAFDARRQDKSLINMYRIDSIPLDTQHRTILDNVDQELHTMKVRLERGRLSKANRGELFHDVPAGYVLNSQGLPELDTD